ncbi:Uncharacterised protein [Vibrio cholerae]|nr:Uncharacterised protein [Vibrio cholerae]
MAKTPSAENLSADSKQAGSHDELYHGKRHGGASGRQTLSSTDDICRDH